MQASDKRTKSAETKVSVTAPKDADVREVDQGEASPQSTAECSPGPSLRRTGRGMSTRRRIGLKIEADEAGNDKSGTSDEGTGKESEGRDATCADGKDGQEGEWWKVEYRMPPPGHLGAHAVPVSITGEDEEKSPTATSVRGRSQSMEANEQHLGRMEVTATQISLSQIPKTHETPERANRKARGGSDRYDESTSHSSPNQKRKIIDLQDTETGSFLTMGVAKELKRFHETNSCHVTLHHSEGESEESKAVRTASMTPSKLLHPMKEIDLEADSTATISMDNQHGAVMVRGPQSSTGKASESA